MPSLALGTQSDGLVQPLPTGEQLVLPGSGLALSTSRVSTRYLSCVALLNICKKFLSTLFTKKAYITTSLEALWRLGENLENSTPSPDPFLLRVGLWSLGWVVFDESQT